MKRYGYRPYEFKLGSVGTLEVHPGSATAYLYAAQSPMFRCDTLAMKIGLAISLPDGTECLFQVGLGGPRLRVFGDDHTYIDAEPAA